MVSPSASSSRPVALVTGGARRVGRAIVTRLASEGFDTAFTYLQSEADARALEIELNQHGARAIGIRADLTDPETAVPQICEAVESNFGRLDVLVNNAQSSTPGTPFEDMDDATMRLTLESGILGTVQHMQAAFPYMKAEGGSIINLGSREGIHGGHGFGIYAATKEGIRGLSRVAAREWGKHNIRVNVICPAALSPIAIRYLAEFTEQAEMYRKEISLGRFGDPERDIGPAAVFLASDASRYVTGQTVNVDGGQMML